MRAHTHACSELTHNPCPIGWQAWEPRMGLRIKFHSSWTNVNFVRYTRCRRHLPLYELSVAVNSCVKSLNIQQINSHKFSWCKIPRYILIALKLRIVLQLNHREGTRTSLESQKCRGLFQHCLKFHLPPFGTGPAANMMRARGYA